MIQPSPNNSDDNLPKQPSVQQNISDGSSNSGTMQSGVGGHDTNIIDGNGNHIIYNYNYPQPSTSSKVEEPTISKEPEIKSWRDRPFAWASLALIPILGVTVFSLPQVQEKLKPSCFDIARKEGKTVIGIAKFHDDTTSTIISPQIEKDIIDRLETQFWVNEKVCILDKSVSLREEAKSLGKSKEIDADVMIWGRRGGSTLKVNITAVKSNVRYLTNLSATENTSKEFDNRTKDWQYLVSVMTAFSLSKIYEEKGQLIKAIDVLNKAVDSAKSKLDKNNKETQEKMSVAYFFLGYFHELLINELDCSNNCQKALVSYQQALQWDNSFSPALISLGALSQRVGKLSEASDFYTQFIKSMPDSPLLLDVHMYRANLYLRQGKAREAVKDLKLVCQQKHDDFDCLRLLGLAQVQAKDRDAMNTYRAIKQYVNKNDLHQNEIVEELQALAKSEPELLSDVNNFIAMLNQ